MTNAEAAEVVSAEFGIPTSELHSVVVPGFAEFYYVTNIGSDSDSNIGREAFVVSILDGKIYPVGSSKHPELDCRDVRQIRRADG